MTSVSTMTTAPFKNTRRSPNREDPTLTTDIGTITIPEIKPECTSRQREGETCLDAPTTVSVVFSFSTNTNPYIPF